MEVKDGNSMGDRGLNGKNVSHKVQKMYEARLEFVEWSGGKFKPKKKPFMWKVQMFCGRPYLKRLLTNHFDPIDLFHRWCA